MKLCGWLLCGLAVLLLASGPVLAADEPAKAEPKKVAPKAPPKPPPSVLRGDYLIMASELKMDDAQKAKLEEKVKAMSGALAAWEKDKGPKVKELQDAVKAAKEKKDEEAGKKAAEELKPLTDEQKKLRETYQAEVMSVLTDDQKVTWENYRYYKKIIDRYAKAKLADDQKAKARALTDAAYAEVKKAGADRKAVAAAEKKLNEDITALLSPEQKAEMEKKPEPKKEEPKKEEPKAAG